MILLKLPLIFKAKSNYYTYASRHWDNEVEVEVDITIIYHSTYLFIIITIVNHIFVLVFSWYFLKPIFTETSIKSTTLRTQICQFHFALHAGNKQNHVKWSPVRCRTKMGRCRMHLRVYVLNVATPNIPLPRCDGDVSV